MSFLEMVSAGDLEDNSEYLVDKIEVNDKEIIFSRKGQEIYFIDHDDVNRDGLAWWVNHVSQKVWFSWNVGRMMLEKVKLEWGLK